MYVASEVLVNHNYMYKCKQSEKQPSYSGTTMPGNKPAPRLKGSGYDLFKILCQALELTRSYHDKYADTIRQVLKTPEFDVNSVKDWGDLVSVQGSSALHVACGPRTRSHVGVQLLLSDERCDVNLRNDNGDTALMVAVKLVQFKGDKHSKIMRLLLAHPRMDINKRNPIGKMALDDFECLQTALHKACNEDIKSHVGAQLLLSDERCDVNACD